MTDNDKQKEMIASMRSAQANMTAALDRITRLEAEIKKAVFTLDTMKGYIPELYSSKDSVAKTMRSSYIDTLNKLREIV